MLLRLEMGGRLTWCSKVKNMFQYGFGYVWVANEVGNEKVFLAIFKQRLKDCSYQIIHSDVHTSAKSIYYKEYKTLLDVERYLSIDMCNKFKRTLFMSLVNGRVGTAYFNTDIALYVLKIIFMSWKTKCILCLFVHCMIP